MKTHLPINNRSNYISYYLAEIEGIVFKTCETGDMKKLALGILSIIILTQFGSCKPKVEHPNIVFFLTDDQGYGDIGIHGNEDIETPVLDDFATQNIRFDHFYVSAVCAPSRASFLTGRYHLRTGVHWVTHREEVMRSEEVTIAEILKEAGYATGCFGKWHNGAQFPEHPNNQGFNEFFGFCGGHTNTYFNPTLEHNGT